MNIISPTPSPHAQSSSRQLYQAGLEFAAARQYQAALDHFEQLVFLQPDRGEAWYHRGDMLANLGQYEAALDSFDQALALQPGQPEFWVFRAVCLLHLDRLEAALDSCDRALAVDSSYRQAWLFRGVTLQRLGHFSEAYLSYGTSLKPILVAPRSLGDRLKQWFRRWFWA